MYAIIKTGGKQVRVKKGDLIDIELLNTEADSVDFKEVLFVGPSEEGKGENLVGTPHVEGYTVTGEILGEVKGPKVISYKFKRRKNYHRKIGHRQRYSRVKITNIAG